jgi:hypothetical protein
MFIKLLYLFRYLITGRRAPFAGQRVPGYRIKGSDSQDLGCQPSVTLKLDSISGLWAMECVTQSPGRDPVASLGTRLQGRFLPYMGPQSMIDPRHL